MSQVDRRRSHSERLKILRQNNQWAERELAAKTAALGRLAGLSSSEGSEPDIDGVLSRLLRKIASSYGLSLDEEALRAVKQNDCPARETVLKFASDAGWRLRPVELEADIHLKAAPPLLAFEAASGGPVVLYPASNRGKLYDPVSDETRPFTARDRAGLETQAFCFYEIFPQSEISKRTLLAFIFRQSRPTLVLVGLLGLVSALLSLLGPLVTEYVTARIIPTANYGELKQLAALLIVLTVCGALFQLVPTLTMLVFGARRYERFQAAVFDHCLRVPVGVYKTCSAGDMTLRLLSASQIQATVFSIITGQFIGAIFNLFSLAMMFYYSPPLAWAGLALVFVYGLGFFLLARVNLKPLAEEVAAEGRLTGLLRQFLSGIGKIRSAAAESRVINRCLDEFSIQTEARYRISRNSAVQAMFSTAFPLVICLVFYALVGGLWLGQMSVPVFLAFMAAFQGFQAGFVGLAGGLWSLLAIGPDLARLMPILQSPPEDSGGREDPGTLDGRVELSHLSFRYAEDLPKTLDDISLRVEPGEFVAIVGPSGAGKSTLVRLLLGFEWPETGAIFYSGRDLAGLDIRKLRRQLGVILQNSRVITASILENIVVGTEYTLDDAYLAIERAALTETVQNMPMGLHTIVSPETISGGQQQRILIARALVGRPALLILDESTSALDNAAQEAVRANLDALRITRIVIAHRLSTIIKADRIYVLDKGRFVQSGTYAELIAQEGLFKSLAQRQRLDDMD